MEINVKSEIIKSKRDNFWNNIHFHPTDAIEDDWGQRILNEVSKDRAADTVRIYAMLEDIVSEDLNGELKYDFTLNDQRIDYMLSKGFNLLISYNFIPACIADKSDVTSCVSKGKTRYKGKMIITSAPKDYSLWEEICYQYTKHIVERYGLKTVKKWYLQCYNEPDGSAFFLSDLDWSEKSQAIRLREYCKLYDAFEKGICKVSGELTIGGPALAEDLTFLEGFIKHIKASGRKLDYICAHTYGTYPRLVSDGSRPFDVNNNLEKYLNYTNIIDKYYPEGIDLIIDEWGAATNGFFNRDECPDFIFRETEKFSAYFAKMVTEYIYKNVNVKKMMICLSGQHEMTEDFTGFRNFFTLHFIKKPIYNAYVLMNKLKQNILECNISDKRVTALPTKGEDGKFAVLITYASKHFDSDWPPIDISIAFDNIYGEKEITVWCIDETHTNPYALYQKNKYGKDLTSEQIEILRREGTLKPYKQYKENADGVLKIDLTLSNNGIMLIEF